MAFELICEIEPPTKPDLKHVRHQIDTMSKVAHAFLIPDNHIGRATVSSVAVAHEVEAMGGRGIACLNSRDRNLLGFRRDLLTAAAYGVEQFLFVYGDKPASGNRTSDLTVRSMIAEAREFSPGSRLGAAAGLRPLPAWKRAADFLFLQVSFSVEAQLRWREAHPVDVPVYAGVMVLASAGHARGLAAAIPDIALPDALVEQVAADRQAGVEAACEQALALRDSGAFDGVHLIPVSRYRDVERMLASSFG
ncbi:methylenetetrahydrofolate reductase [Nonomuraea deserti]|uniref:Methylenetetrahydrofolate reductase n=1 Tax=Nonomuraea deserti TaxID=1848322 RepID=A0A4R4W1A6_9ACTN|nr:methylenetetrahydrofolate reductase [Nonomuraea deserti]TDD08715.1 methylenetetrahydrofolate reductase [Nonomuraea deserti]